LSGGLKITFTVRSWFIEIIHWGETPEQPPPLQLPNVNGDEGIASRVTLVLSGNANVHVGLQLMPAGLLLTVPLPDVMFIVSVLGGGRLNVAITDWDWLMVTTHVGEVAEQPPPLQPPKRDGEVGEAVRVTSVLKG
jgi:hypothetical protein